MGVPAIPSTTGRETMTDDNRKPRLENRLKVARAEKGLSQGQLADLASVTRQTISSIETGQYVPSALLAFILAKRLEKRVDELFTLAGDEP